MRLYHPGNDTTQESDVVQSIVCSISPVVPLLAGGVGKNGQQPDAADIIRNARLLYGEPAIAEAAVQHHEDRQAAVPCTGFGRVDEKSPVPALHLNRILAGGRRNGILGKAEKRRSGQDERRQKAGEPRS